MLNVYKLNLPNTENLIHKSKIRTSIISFLEKTEQTCHSYTRRFSTGSQRRLKTKLRNSRFQIFVIGPVIQNDSVGRTNKEIQLTSFFKTKTINKLSIRKNIFACLFSVHNIKCLSRHDMMATIYYIYNTQLLISY